MTDRLLRVALVVVLVLGALTSAVEAHNPSPSFAVRVVPATNALHFVMFDDLGFLLRTMDAFLTPATGSVQ